MDNLIAKASVIVGAPVDRVWAALITPSIIQRYMFGATVRSDFREGSPITWRGEWKGKSFEDKGQIRRVEPRRLLEYTHFSSLSGEADKPENYHSVSVELTDLGHRTRVTLTQSNSASEEARQHSERNWSMMLASLKRVVEEDARPRSQA